MAAALLSWLAGLPTVRRRTGARDDALDVEEVMDTLVQGVAGKPGQIALGGRGPVVDQAPLPGGALDRGEGGGAQLARHLQLLEHRRRPEGAVAADRDALVAVHPSKARAFLDPGEHDALTLDEQHVADVGEVLRR